MAGTKRRRRSGGKERKDSMGENKEPPGVSLGNDSAEVQHDDLE